MSILDSRAVNLGDKYSLTGIPASANLFLTITNDSPFTVQFYFDNNSGDTQVLPADSIVDNLEPAPSVPSLRPSNGWGGKITFSIIAPLGGTAPQNPPAQQVTVEGFATRQQTSRFALARSVAVGGTVSTTQASAIIAAGQVDGLTVNFENGLGLPAQDMIDLRSTANDTGKTHGLYLDSYDGAAYNHEISAYAGVSILRGTLTIPNGGLGVSGGATSLAGGHVSNVAGEPTAGVLGVPVTPAVALLTSVTVLTAVNVLDFTPVNNGFYRVNVSMILANGTNGNAITVKVTYRNSAGLFTANIKFINGASEAMAAGVTSFANASWAGEPLTFYATTAGHIQVSFQDPTNTPNDTVSAVLERLA